jgi:DNA-binding CsgD family transcriptional regulator
MASMLCKVLVGRSAELKALTSALDAASEGHGSAVFARGESGIGKSRLAREAAAAARARGFLVLYGHASESAVPEPFRPIADALADAAKAGITPDSPGAGDYGAALGSLVPEWSRPGDSTAEISPLIVGEALLRILSLPGWRGGLLVLDDLHWADPETIAIAEYLADNAGTAGVCCLCTVRDSEPSPGLDLLGSLTARRSATTIEVPRLTQADVLDMASACLDVSDAPPAVAQLLASCEGLPFAVEEILAAAVASGELVRADHQWSVNKQVVTAMPASIVGSVRRRLTAMGARARTVIVAAALLGRKFDWALLPAVSGVPEAETLDVLQQAQRMQLIVPASSVTGWFRFRHSLTRAAIVSSLEPPDLARQTDLAATVVESAHPGLPGPWCDLAAELRTTAGQPVEAARLRLTAGRRALSHGAISSARTSLREARKLLDGATGDVRGLRGYIEDALAEALGLAGDYEELDQLIAGLMDGLDVAGADRERAAFILIRAASALPQDHWETAAARITRATELARGLDNPELAGRVGAISARTALVSGDIDGAGQLAREALAAAEEAGLTGWAAEVGVAALGVIGHTHRMSSVQDSRAAYQRADEIADQHRLAVPRIRTLHTLASIDMLADGQTDALVGVQRRAHEAGLLSIAAIIDLQLANFWSMSTELDQAFAAAARCERDARRLASRRLEALAISHQAMIHGIRGEIREARKAAARAEESAPDDPTTMMAVICQARVVTELFRDDVSRAAQLSAAADSYRHDALSTPERARGFFSSAQAPLAARGWAWGLNALLQAAAGGDIEAAIDVATAAAANDRWNHGCLAYARAVLAGREGELARATELARAGSGWLAAFAPWWDQLAQRLVAPEAVRNSWGDPVSWMRNATAAFAASGHIQLASACRGILREAGEPVPRSGRGAARVPPQLRGLGVTSREMDVFLLVGQGRTNAEIAERLFISPKTVETHIANLAVKMRQAGRRELAVHAAHFVDR